MTQPKFRILTVVGTRPEAIKLAPLIEALQRAPEFDPVVLATAQHRDLLDQSLDTFGLEPDIDLDLMRSDQTPAAFLASAVGRIADEIVRLAPAIVVVQGDTVTALTGALSAFFVGCPIAHVEAGLRSHNRFDPYPEELNRRLVGQLADVHLAPTEANKRNLIEEGVSESSIYVTGNPIIDALRRIITSSGRSGLEGLPAEARRKRIVLVTAHRRESFGAPLRDICSALRALASEFEDIAIVWPVHPNPNIRDVVFAELHGVERVHLIDPLGYEAFVGLMQSSYLILSDSGGVQEEAPTLNRPVLVLRDTTERPEGIAVGAARLVGRDAHAILDASRELLGDKEAYVRMVGHRNPYGDGRATERIIESLRAFLSAKDEEEER